MTIAITFEGSTGPDDLPGWLALEEDLRGRLRTMSGQAAPETMGWDVVVGAAVAAVPVLTRSICGYLVERDRLRKGDLFLTYTAEDGREVQVRLTGATEPAALAETLLAHRSVTITEDGDASSRS
ncbi:hypothetical protein VA596_24660 [Amycolatopsis sp., V23-08]|uniref:Uncharacterized protein n=1 Tax=Amycolatopsis heterodermiae TaxID=3110235 RepID=A0ABU5RC08_9PSEU|nr:hypothetical protein [Amycolatopsis sp., V23-08]MEA5362751.1 hypothetical protein [Amycolatopsis sp., V23-08]